MKGEKRLWIKKKIGKYIAKCRKEKKITQAELGERLGVTEKSISNWEYRESLAKSINGDKIPIGFRWEFDEEKDYKNIIVYYINQPLKKISQMQDREFLKELQHLYKMCSLN